jgi:hypothetical protein
MVSYCAVLQSYRNRQQAADSRQQTKYKADSRQQVAGSRQQVPTRGTRNERKKMPRLWNYVNHAIAKSRKSILYKGCYAKNPDVLGDCHASFCGARRNNRPVTVAEAVFESNAKSERCHTYATRPRRSSRKDCVGAYTAALRCYVVMLLQPVRPTMICYAAADGGELQQVSERESSRGNPAPKSMLRHAAAACHAR